jgi:hypothetical protein
MTKTMIFSIGGLSLVLALLLACSSLSLAVRQGVLPEINVRFPPNTRFQLILRVGEDAMPWRNSRAKDMAINLWAHQQGTSWHIINIVHVSLGERPENES